MRTIEVTTLDKLLDKLLVDPDFLLGKTVKVASSTSKHEEYAGCTLTNFICSTYGICCDIPSIQVLGEYLSFGTLLEINSMPTINLKEIYANY